MITVCGITLSFATGSLSQWRKDKWAFRRQTQKDVILTRGNGSAHAIIILGNQKGLDLEDLAASSGDSEYASIKTKALVITLAFA
jgi:hypothetical protein